MQFVRDLMLNVSYFVGTENKTIGKRPGVGMYSSFNMNVVVTESVHRVHFSDEFLSIRHTDR